MLLRNALILRRPRQRPSRRTPARSLWDFSIAVYARPGVAPACLALQDRRGVDVNVLLLCCWAGASGRLLSKLDLAAALVAVREWRDEVVQPLRALRRRLKAGVAGIPTDQAEAMRRRVADLELEAERIAQMRLAASPPRFALQVPAGPAPAFANLECYFDLLGLAAAPADGTDLEALVGGCFPVDVNSADDE